ncbi:MAG: uracil-DNA glycosylase [Anaerolineales bacterium]|nr:uracil-DNA glycosylase [Anaerolineales bacterium]MCX7608136.1 uracil-DNA glycosylase [Anaerolineales bacterium]MDW8226273.1 uracil-DNA glycosylase [Anaerolineales bacterium]
MDSLETLNADLLACRRCPRLVIWREQIARQKRRAYRDWDYWGKPVPGFGDPTAQVLVVGLAPGAHGSNRTGRMFTGDASGDFLYPALYRAGFADQPVSTSRDDGLTLRGLYITAVCRCAPPGNKPTPHEIRNCLPYLQAEIELLQPRVFVALGRIAFNALKSLLAAPATWAFAHGALYRLPGGRWPTTDCPTNKEHGSTNTDRWLLASYHPSRQNTQTGRLTTTMFDEIWQIAHRFVYTP